MQMVVIAAMDRNGAIGRENAIPWSVPEDLQRFKERTMGHPMIMGSRTWKSFNQKALPGRQSIIVTSRPDDIEIREQDADRVSIAANLDIAISKAASLAAINDRNQYFVIGGASIYEQVIERCDIFDITIIDTVIEDADTFFPRDKMNDYIEKNNFTFMEYESTLGYQVISESGLKFEVKCVIKS
jgi:dihydrofolate reductase